MTEKPIEEVVETFVREIIEEASREEVMLTMKLEAFKVVTSYLVGIHKVGANEKGKHGISFDQMKDELKDLE